MIKISVKLQGRTIDNFSSDKPVVTVGRDKSCDVCVDNPLLSRRHAQITQADGKHYIEDLNSTNGVFLNGNKVNKAEIHNGDEFRIDKFSFQVQIADSAPAAKKEFAFDNMMGTMQIDARALQEKLRAEAAAPPAPRPAAAAHAPAQTAAPASGARLWIGIAIGLVIGFVAGYLARGAAG